LLEALEIFFNTETARRRPWLRPPHLQREAKPEYAKVRQLHSFWVEARLALVRRLLASDGLPFHNPV